jgi:hypothetical protein
MRAPRRWPASRPAASIWVIYLASEFGDRYQPVLARLGPHKTGKGCLYIKRLDDVDSGALRDLIDRSVRVHRGIDRAAT